MHVQSGVCSRCGRTLDDNELCPSCTLLDPMMTPASISGDSVSAPDSAGVSDELALASASASASASSVGESSEIIVSHGTVSAGDGDDDRDKTVIDGFAPDVLGPVATPVGSDDVAVGGPVREEFEVFRHQSVHQAVARVKELAPGLAPANKRPALIMAATAIARRLLTELQARDAWCGVIQLRRDPGETDISITCTVNGDFIEKRTTAT